MTIRANRPALVAHARESIAKGSKSFWFASKLFDPATRERAWLLYSWCRACDDMMDGQDHGGALSTVDDPAARLAQLQSLTTRALAGEATGNPAFDALGLVAAECAIPHAYPHDLVDGMAMDAAAFRPQTQADLMRYCYHVAGVVGLMMACVMGVDPDDTDTMQRANDLGLAFQLNNIARDVMEDAQGGRCYLPADWLAEVSIIPRHCEQSEAIQPDVSELLRSARKDEEGRKALATLTRRLAALSAPLEASARIGAMRLPFRSRWAVLAAAGIYGDIGREVARLGEAALDQRVSTSAAGKLLCVGKAWFQARRGI
jgi:phytoene synthase